MASPVLAGSDWQRGAGADHERHPERQDLIDINAGVGQHPINLFDRVPGIQAASHCQAMANRADRQQGRVHHPQRGIGERGDALGPGSSTWSSN